MTPHALTVSWVPFVVILACAGSPCLAQTPTLRLRIDADQEDVNHLAFSPDGKTLATCASPLRHIAIGRKNWLFAGSHSGAETAAILFSITSTCHRHGVDAFAYVHELLARLAHDREPAPEVLRDWLPDRWQLPEAPNDS